MMKNRKKKKLPDMEKRLKKFAKKIFQIRGQKGTRKWVVEVMSSHFMFFLLKMGHSSIQETKRYLLATMALNDCY